MVWLGARDTNLTSAYHEFYYHLLNVGAATVPLLLYLLLVWTISLVLGAAVQQGITRYFPKALGACRRAFFLVNHQLHAQGGRIEVVGVGSWRLSIHSSHHDRIRPGHAVLY